MITSPSLSILKRLPPACEALLRRNSGLASQVISLPPFQVDLSRRELSVNDQPIKLTAFEYTIMETLIRNRGKVVSKRFADAPAFTRMPNCEKATPSTC